MTDYNKWTVKALRDYCKERNIKIPVKSKKADIVSLIENTPFALEVEPVYDPITERRQNIIKEVLLICKKVGEKKILNYFKQRNENTRLKQTFTIHKLNLQNPTTYEIRICLKYYQELYEYDEDDKLLINQMITQSKYIDPNYVDPRQEEFKQFVIDSATYDIPISTSKARRKLNEIKSK